jgi:hypothetical protein
MKKKIFFFVAEEGMVELFVAGGVLGPAIGVGVAVIGTFHFSFATTTCVMNFLD